MKEVILTGLRSNDEMTLGNYIGAIMPMGDKAVAHAKDYSVHMFVPDLHSFTTPVEHTGFKERTMRNLKLFVAAGLPLDNTNIHIYRQSYVSAHSELTWILMNFTGTGDLERMTEYKSKKQKLNVQHTDYGLKESLSRARVREIEVERLEDMSRKIEIKVSNATTAGLFAYPVLMAADILLYGAKWVPVGEDQRQHLEFARKIAERMNNKFNVGFVIPETLENQQKFVGRSEAPRIRSLRNPTKKMSKSIADPAGTILLSDSPEAARKKIMSAETDSVGVINYDWTNQPGVANLLTILASLSHRPQQEVNDEWTGNERYGDLKKATADAVCAVLADLQTKVESIPTDDVLEHLEKSEAHMNIIANAKLLEVQKAIGLR